MTTKSVRTALRHTVVLSILLIAAAYLTSSVVLAQSDPPTQPILRLNLSGHSAQITQLEVTPDRSRLLTVSVDKTVKIWDSSTLRLLRTIRVPISSGFEGGLYASAISPDGKIAAISGFTGFTFERSISVYLINLDNGEIEGRVAGFDEVVTNMRFSLNGSRLYVALSRNLGFRVVDIAQRRIIAEDRNYAGNTIGIEHIGDAGIATSSHDGKIRFYDQNGAIKRVIEFEQGSLPTAIRANASRSLLAVGFMNEPRVSIVELNDNDTIRPLDISCFTKQANTPRVFWGPDSRFLYAYGTYEGDGGAPLYRWQVSGGNFSVCEKIITSRRNFSDMDVLDANNLAFVTTDPSIGILSLDSLSERSVGTTVTDFRNASGQLYLSRRADKVIYPNKTTGELWQFDFFAKSLSVYTDDYLDGFTNNSRHGLDTQYELPATDITIEGVRLPAAEYETINDFVPYANGNIAAATEFGIFLSNSGKILSRVTTPSHVEAITLSADQQTLVALLADGTMQWFDALNLKRYFSFFADLTNNPSTPEWVGWTEDGYYISSNYGDNLIGWHFNNSIDEAADFYTALQYERLLYRPDRVIAAFEKVDSTANVPASNPLSNLRNISPGDLELEIVDNSGNEAKIKVSASKRQLEHIDLAVFVNNIPVLSGNDRKLSAREATAIERTLEIPLFAKKNNIRVELFNGQSIALAEELIESNKTPERKRKGQLYVVAIGVNEFTEPDNDTLPDLRYAANDASGFLESIVENSNGLYSKVHYREVSDFSSVLPTKENIEETLKLVSEATALDTVVIFLASHGISDAAGNYFFVPRDVRSGDVEQLITTGIAGDSLIGWESFLQAMRSAAGKRLLVVDTCYARGISGPQDTHSLAKRSASASFGLLAASQDTEESQENQKLRHGLFTWALIEALGNDSDTNNDNVKSLSEIYSYLVPAVEERRDKSQPQNPQLIALPILQNMALAQ